MNTLQNAEGIFQSLQKWAAMEKNKSSSFVGNVRYFGESWLFIRKRCPLDKNRTLSYFLRQIHKVSIPIRQWLANIINFCKSYFRNFGNHNLYHEKKKLYTFYLFQGVTTPLQFATVKDRWIRLYCLRIFSNGLVHWWLREFPIPALWGAKLVTWCPTKTLPKVATKALRRLWKRASTLRWIAGFQNFLQSTFIAAKFLESLLFSSVLRKRLIIVRIPWSKSREKRVTFYKNNL